MILSPGNPPTRGLFGEPLVQVAYFVSDARASAARMARDFGAGPFFFIPRIELAWGEHRGQPCRFLHSSAYGQWGEVMMELVQQDEDGPSPFRDLFAPGQEGLHHIAVMVDSLPDTFRLCEQAGIEVATRAATVTGTEFAFVDTIATMGHLVEVYERAPPLLNFYAMVRAAAEGWDGRDPVRAPG